MVIKNDFESWLKSSAARFIKIYTNGNSVVGIRCSLALICVLFVLIAISCITILIGENFMDIGQVIGTDLGMVSIKKIFTENPDLFNLLLWFSTIFSLLSLWTMKLLRSRRKQIEEFYYFWEKHIESGRELLKGNS